MTIRYLVIEYDIVINVVDLDEEIISWFIPHIYTIFPTWEWVPIDECVKRDDGNPAGIWIGWIRDVDGIFYDASYIPEEPEEP